MKTISGIGDVSIPILEKLDEEGALARHESDGYAFASGEQV